MADSYKDRDTFEIKTGATTNEITIRTTWAATGADLDLFVFDKAAPAAMAPSHRPATTRPIN